jgi:CRP-like cAMP-binding protein
MDIDKIIDNIYSLPEQSRIVLKERVSEVAYPKGYNLLKADKVETKIYFIKKGIVRAYTDLLDNEITFWFGREGDTIVSMKSYVADQKGYENVELLEDCELYELKKQYLSELFDRDIHIANWGRKFAEQELVKTEERFIARQFRTSLERYKELMRENPDLLQRVQLGYIASYLGITQVSLSRIRAKFR